MYFATIMGVLIVIFPLYESSHIRLARNISQTSLVMDSRDTQDMNKISAVQSQRSKREALCKKGQSVCPFRNQTTGMEVCFSPCQKCDGIPDCPQATDEGNCPCRPRIPAKYICDGKIDCQDYSDELGCGECFNDELECDDGCTTLSSFCNGKNCLQFSRPLLCTRLSHKIFDHSKENQHRSRGYLQLLFRTRWLPLCSEGAQLTTILEKFCEAITGISKNNHMYKVEKTSANQFHWSSIEINGGGSFSITEVSSCPQNKVVYVQCSSPTCQNGTKLHEFNIELPSFEGRIVGGREASFSTASVMVRISRDGIHHCGGSVLSPHWVLSAAHCFSKISRRRYEIETGSNLRRTFPPSLQRVVVSHVIRHPEFDAYNLSNDVALVKLATPLQLNRWTRSPCFGTEELNLHGGDTCRVAGWGYNADKGELPETLQEVNLPILKDNMCLKDYTSFESDKNICAGDMGGKRDSCQGDSGGPMICFLCNPEDNPFQCENRPWYLAGMVSYGKSCALQGTAGVYTKLSYFKDWIFDTIALMERDPSLLPSAVPRTVCSGLQCVHSSGLCLEEDKICDGKVDCLDALDEVNCGESIDDDENYYYEYGDLEEEKPQATSIGSFTCPDNYYRCEVYSSCVSNSLLCDEKRDCPDGTDEIGCTCVDRLFLLQQDKLCDGAFDCFDYTDEFCDFCGTSKWFCSRSKQCINETNRCDNTPDCTYGEDELHCLTLAPTAGELLLDDDQNPLVSKEGYLLLLSNFQWIPVCSVEITFEVATDVCSYLGFDSPLSIKYESNLPTDYALRTVSSRPRRSIYNGNSKHTFLFSSEGLTVDGIQMENFYYPNFTSGRSQEGWQPWRDFSASSERKKRTPCNQARIECGEKVCGKVQSLSFSHSPPLDDAGHAPWGVALFHREKYLCGGTLVGMQWVMTSLRCLGNINLSRSKVYALGGSSRGVVNGAKIFGPNEVVLRVDAVLEVDAQRDVALLHLQESVVFIEQMNALCLNKSYSSLKECIMVGHHGSRLNYAFLLVPEENVDCPDDKVCLNGYFPTENFCTGSWAGLIACREQRRTDSPWTAVALWNFTNDQNCEQASPKHFQKLTSDLIMKMESIMDDANVSTTHSLPCQGHKCPLRDCIDSLEVCDAQLSCPDLSDENFSCPVTVSVCRTNDSTGTCDCLQDWHKCKDGICLEPEKVCDGFVQCSDGDDEENCPCSRMVNVSKEVTRCDGVIDCTDESDELECSCNSHQQFRCFRSSTEKCIDLSLLCDNVPDCPHNEDEGFCFTISTTIIPEETALGIPVPSRKGFFLLRLQGKWFTYATRSHLPDEDICTVLGFSGVVETTTRAVPIDMLITDEFVPISGKIGQINDTHEVVFIECLA